MKTEKPPESPNSDEAPSQKQDPLERRRLQNRLSQRNHRRKIRDRIAKLQERVIANELRAAAALNGNGWDPQFTPSPLVSTRHTSHQESSITISRDFSPMTTEPATPFMPTYNLSTAPSWSSLSPGLLPGDQPSFVEGLSFASESMCSESSVTSRMDDVGIQAPAGSNIEGDIFQDVFTEGFSNVFANTPSNQPLYYVATETALPHIIQVLSAVSPQSKIIVLVPPDSASTVTASGGYPSPAPTLMGNSGLEPLSPSNLACHCQVQNTQTVPRPWSTPGSYVPGYPSHKSPSTPDGGFSMRF